MILSEFKYAVMEIDSISDKQKPVGLFQTIEKAEEYIKLQAGKQMLTSNTDVKDNIIQLKNLWEICEVTAMYHYINRKE